MPRFYPVACLLAGAGALSLLALSVSGARAQLLGADFLSGPTTVGHSGNSATTLGFTFNVTSAVVVSGLGYFDDGQNGLSESHDVGIFDSAGSLLVSTTIDPGTFDPLTGKFRFAAIAPFALPVGAYTIGGTIGATASDPVAYDVAGLTSAPGIGIPSGASRYAEAGSYTSLTFPTLSYPVNAPYNAYFGPDFLIAPAATGSVPEPGPMALLACASAPLAGRLLRRGRS